jgi:hypothetical protein
MDFFGLMLASEIVQLSGALDLYSLVSLLSISNFYTLLKSGGEVVFCALWYLDFC